MTERKNRNLTWHEHKVGRKDQERQSGHRGAILWFTGLSGSGKSTVANEAAYKIHQRGGRTYVLDGDNVRHGLNKDLGFSPEDRTENIRRIGEVAKLFVDAGTLVLTAFISPYRADRDQVRAIVGDGEFIEVFTQCSLEVCEQRDPKGLYEKARAGEIPEFTGISAPYEPPESPELLLQTDASGVEACADRVLEYLDEKGYFRID